MASAEEDKKSQQPVIVKKGKGGHGGHHGGAWKVAYADFVTAMMAFFLVMWLVGQSDAVKENVGGYFRDPVKHAKGSGIMKSEGGTKPVIGKEAEMRRKLEEEVKAALTELGESLRREIKANRAFDIFEGQIEIELTEEGLRIQLIESSNTPFFKKGSDELAQFARPLLKTIGHQLGKMPNRVVIEGHTDAHRYPDSARYTNWELSVDRANFARRVMLDGGLRKNQVCEVRGFADRQLRNQQNPTDPHNRRISITVLNDYDIYRYSDTLYVDFAY